MFVNCTSVKFIFANVPYFIPAKKRLKESVREGDDRLSKKARRLAESSQGPKNSILRHMQSGVPGATSRTSLEKKGASKFLHIYSLSMYVFWP